MFILLALCVPLALILIRLFIKSNMKRCHSNNQMVGKVVIITGANSGIGFNTAKDLALRGARVILACRNEDRGLEACKKIIAETSNQDVVYKHMDLASLASVRKFANNILETESRLDVLVNNAGVYGLGHQYSEDGIVEGMQINHFGPFLLTNLLLPLLKRSKRSRIINVSSLFHILAVTNLMKVNQIGYIGPILYANSKLCNLLFTLELARRLEGTGVVSNSVHPGIIFTNIFMSVNIIFRILFKTVCFIATRTVEEGAQTIIYAAVSEECGNVTGKHFVDCQEGFKTWRANDKRLALDLWNLSEKLVGNEKS